MTPRTLLVALAVVTVLTVLTSGVVVTPAHAAPPPSVLRIGAPVGYADGPATVTVTLTSAGQPVAGAEVRLERLVDRAWVVLPALVTDEAGRAERTVRRSRVTAQNRLRVTYAGDVDHAATRGSVALALRRRTSVVVVAGPATVLDERSAVLTVDRVTRSGEPVAGPVRLYRRTATTGWTFHARLRTDRTGHARWRLTPREDTWWRVEVPRNSWASRDTSPVLSIDNLPPGEPVELPRRAPQPRVHVPPQPHATGAGAHPVVTDIPDGVWRDMTGRSWHRGCPVGRSGLRLVRVNYWDYDGYRRRGEVVVATGAADQVAGALAEMYDRDLPIRSMYRVDRFGYSGRLHGGDDYRSMAAGNTSGFNCRDVVNRPGVRSPHSWGRSLDVNTWENPYASATGLVPNAWWQSHRHPRVAWRSLDHPVVQVMARHGLRWTYGLGDTQHFDAAHGDGRVLVTRACRLVACD